MGKQKIDDKDQELIQKFRSVVHLKQQQERENRKIITTVLVICCAVLVPIVVYFAFHGPAQPPAPSEKAGSSETVTVVRPQVAVDRPPDTTPPEEAVPSRTGGLSAESIASGEVSAGGAAPSEDSAGAANNVPEQAAPIEPAPPQTRAPSPEPAKTPSEPAKTSPEPAKTPPEPEPADTAEGIRIAEIVACKKVVDRQYVAPQTVFSLEQDSRPDVWVWMDVRADEQRIPYTLRHVYSVEGREYATVPLTIRYTRMRTWSNITLKRPDLVGQWRVAVVAETGETLAEIEFEVVP